MSAAARMLQWSVGLVRYPGVIRCRFRQDRLRTNVSGTGDDSAARSHAGEPLRPRTAHLRLSKQKAILLDALAVSIES